MKELKDTIRFMNDAVDENEGKPVSIVLKETEDGIYSGTIKGDYGKTIEALQRAIIPIFMKYTRGMCDEMRLLMADGVGAEVGRVIRERLLEGNTDDDEIEETEDEQKGSCADAAEPCTEDENNCGCANAVCVPGENEGSIVSIFLKKRDEKTQEVIIKGGCEKALAVAQLIVDLFS